VVWRRRPIRWAKFSAPMASRRYLVEIPFEAVFRRRSMRRPPLFRGCCGLRRLFCPPSLSTSTLTAYVWEGWAAAVRSVVKLLPRQRYLPLEGTIYVIGVLCTPWPLDGGRSPSVQESGHALNQVLLPLAKVGGWDPKGVGHFSEKIPDAVVRSALCARTPASGHRACGSVLRWSA
jgi:hypothetical protein